MTIQKISRRIKAEKRIKKHPEIDRQVKRIFDRLGVLLKESSELKKREKFTPAAEYPALALERKKREIEIRELKVRFEELIKKLEKEGKV